MIWSLQVLRFVAALMVVYVHAAQTADAVNEIERYRQNMRRAIDRAIKAGAEPSAVPVVLEELADAVDRLLAEARKTLQGFPRSIP